jgi:hypothetical protein
MDSRERAQAEVEREPRGGDIHVHSTVKIRGATVLPNWFVVVLILSLSLSLAASGAAAVILFWRVSRLEGELWLLQDYTEGRISDVPYRPPAERREPGLIQIERSE